MNKQDLGRKKQAEDIKGTVIMIAHDLGTRLKAERVTSEEMRRGHLEFRTNERLEGQEGRGCYKVN